LIDCHGCFRPWAEAAVIDGGQKSECPPTSEKGWKRLSMNSRKVTFLLGIIGTVFAGIFCLSSCEKAANPVSKLTRASFDQIHENMSKEEVKAILGSPSSTTTEDKLIYKRTTWRYVEGDKYINITFKNDQARRLGGVSCDRRQTETNAILHRSESNSFIRACLG